jgi:hypothetical protein
VQKHVCIAVIETSSYIRAGSVSEKMSLYPFSETSSYSGAGSVSSSYRFIEQNVCLCAGVSMISPRT